MHSTTATTDSRCFMNFDKCIPHPHSFYARFGPGKAHLPIQVREEHEPLRTQQPVVLVVTRDVDRLCPRHVRRVLHQAARRVKVSAGCVEVLQWRVLAALNPAEAVQMCGSDNVIAREAQTRSADEGILCAQQVWTQLECIKCVILNIILKNRKYPGSLTATLVCLVTVLATLHQYCFIRARVLMILNAAKPVCIGQPIWFALQFLAADRGSPGPFNISVITVCELSSG